MRLQWGSHQQPGVERGWWRSGARQALTPHQPCALRSPGRSQVEPGWKLAADSGSGPSFWSVTHCDSAIGDSDTSARCKLRRGRKSSRVRANGSHTGLCEHVGDVHTHCSFGEKTKMRNSPNVHPKVKQNS